jgi:hypothetical protein
MKLSIKYLVALVITVLPLTGCTESKPDETHTHAKQAASENTQPARINLSPETTELLVQEMRLLQEGMNQIMPALVAGEWQKIEQIGQKMKDSYIMKKSLTKAQMHELHESLPADFQELDHSFHHSSGLLSQAASQKDYERVSHYYIEMLEACVNCHTLYATHKFPQFLKSGKQQ